MNPVPDRKTFITTVVRSLAQVYNHLQSKNTHFAEGLKSCHTNIVKYLGLYPEPCTLNDIVDCFEDLNKLNYFGADLSGEQVNLMNDVKEYMQEYELSQKVQTKSRKVIPTEYTKQDEGEFIKDTIDFLANLYNISDQRTPISKSIRECVEIFWEYDVTWQRKQEIATRDTIQELQTNLLKIKVTDGYEHTPTGKQLRLLILYIKNWFFYEVESVKPQKSTSDINTRVETLEKEVEELRAQLNRVLILYAPELARDDKRLLKLVSMEHKPTLERNALLQQLARCL